MRPYLLLLLISCKIDVLLNQLHLIKNKVQFGRQVFVNGYISGTVAIVSGY